MKTNINQRVGSQTVILDVETLKFLRFSATPEDESLNQRLYRATSNRVIDERDDDLDYSVEYQGNYDNSIDIDI